MSAQPTILILSGPVLCIPGPCQREIDGSETPAASRDAVSDLGSLGSFHAPDARARWIAEATA